MSGYKTHRRKRGLIIGIVPHSKIWVVQCLFTGNPLRRVKVQQLSKEIESEVAGTGEQSVERYARSYGERTDVILGTRGTNATEGIFRWSTKVMQDLIELVDVAIELGMRSRIDPRCDRRTLDL